MTPDPLPRERRDELRRMLLEDTSDDGLLSLSHYSDEVLPLLDAADERDRLAAERVAALAAVDGVDCRDIDQRDNATPDELRAKLLGCALQIVEVTNERDRLAARVAELENQLRLAYPATEGDLSSAILRYNLQGMADAERIARDVAARLNGQSATVADDDPDAETLRRMYGTQAVGADKAADAIAAERKKLEGTGT